MTIFERTKSIAKQKGLTLKQVEEKAGLSETSLYNWKRSNPKSENLEKVAKVLNVSVDYLLGNTEEPNGHAGEAEAPDIEKALDGALSYSGKPLSENDRQIMKALIEGYLQNKKD